MSDFSASAVPTLVTVGKAVELLGGHVSKHMLYRGLAAGQLKGHRPAGKTGRWLIDVEDLARWARGEVAT